MSIENKIVFMCGSHMRHMYIADKLRQEGRLAALVIEEREELFPEPPERLGEKDKELFIHHFTKREETEKKFFGHVNREELLESVPVLRITKEELNSDKNIEFLRQFKDNFLITYGTHIVKDDILNLFEGHCFNIHGGLSPWYRGTITLFWPFYLLRPNWAGMTVHRLTAKLDGGEVLHQSMPTLEYGDGIHDVAAKAVVQVAEDLCEIMSCLDNGAELVCIKQKGSGKLFVDRDWAPEHLRVIYELFDDKIVDKFLDGEFEVVNPKLVNFFDKE